MRLAFVLIFLLAIALRVICLDKSLNGDEMNSVLGARQNIESIFSYVAQNDSYPPLQHILLHFWLRLGTSESWIRMLYVIFGIGTCLLVYFIGKEYVNNRFGLYSLFFVSISPQLINLSQYARGIAISTFFICLSVYFLVRIFKSEAGLANWIGYLFSSICAVYSFYFAVLVVIAENLYMLWARHKNKMLIRNWIFSQSLILFFYLPWIPFFIRQVVGANIANNAVAVSHKGFFISGFHVGSLTRGILGTFGLDQLFLMNVALSRKLPLVTLITITGICLFLLLVIILRSGRFFKEEVSSAKLPADFFQLLIVTTIVLTTILRHFRNFPVMSRYFTSLSVFFIFIIVAAILSFKDKKLKVSLLVLLATVFLIRLPQIYPATEQWREVARYVEKNFGSEDCIVFLEKGRSDYNYYSRLKLPQFILAKYFTRASGNSDYICIDTEKSTALFKLIKPYKRIWVILTHTKVFGGKDLLREWFLRNSFEEEATDNFAGVEVLKFTLNKQQSY